MADFSVLADVKNALGITGDFQDATIKVYMEDVMDFMEGAGVPKAVINSQKSVGAIARGVSDLWNYNGGAVKFSEYFLQRVTQLAHTKPDTEEVAESV